MRTAWILGGMSLIIVAAANARAEQGSEAVITDNVEVRSGPSLTQEFYPTSKLYRGEKVHVLHSENTGWLAITPPTGSFSWVNAREVVQQTPHTVIVNVDGCTLRVGSGVVNQPPEVTRFKVPKGSVLTVIDNPHYSGNDTWLPVLPAPHEERYIPAAAVRGGPLVQQTLAPPIATPTSFTSTTTADPNANINALKARAEKADLGGNFSEAIGLYEQAARETKDFDERVRLLNRAQFLRDGQRGATLVSRPAGPAPGVLTSNAVESRMAAPPVYTVSQPTAFYPAGRPATSQYCYIPDPCNTVRLASPLVHTPPPPLTYTQAAVVSQPIQPAGPQAQWYGPAHLRRAPFFLDGKPAYALEGDDGKVHAYVTAGSNLELEPYVNRTVQLYGPVTYHGMMRTNYMTALQVNPVR
jgi:uncharacterized protein YgiM (DUF1202 family)